MATEIKVPVLGESISEATVTTWLKSVGDSVAADEPILELETDKVTMEVNAPASGTLTDIVADPGADVEVGALLGMIGEPATDAVSASAPLPAPQSEHLSDAANINDAAMPPSVRKLVDENGLDPSQITGTGKDGRLTKGDVLLFIKENDRAVRHLGRCYVASTEHCRAVNNSSERRVTCLG